MKKLGVFIMIMVFLTAAVFAGGGGEGASGGKTPLLLWLPPFASDNGEALDKEFWTRTLAPWADENKVNLTIEITPWANYEEKYLTGFSSGIGPDVGYMYNEMLNDFIDMGAVLKLDSYFTAEDKAKYLHFGLGNMKGGQYTVPFVVGNGRIMYFNKDLLAKAGVTALPKTWNDFIQTGLKIKNANLGSDIIVFGQEWADPAIGGLNAIYYPYLWQAGGEFFDSAGKLALQNNDAAVRAAQFVYDLMHVHGIVPQECLSMAGSEINRLFRDGKVAIYISGTSFARTLDSEGKVKWDFIPSLEDKKGAVWVASDALMVNAASKQKDLAVKLVKHITSSRIMEAFHREIYGAPPIAAGEAYLDEPKFQDMYEKSPYLKSMPVAKNAATMGDNLFKNLQRMMHQEISPQQAIQATADYYKSLQ
ncbi:MAG: sugar ABC transporter substrate-binding protein [Treponema sp.]|jgi:multiple sugar transport system substrate-binding protein|nr:sugar ABC transporter substrate-binding protein [Treponema sp.]